MQSISGSFILDNTESFILDKLSYKCMNCIDF